MLVSACESAWCEGTGYFERVAGTLASTASSFTAIAA
jgi:hypothetical protein